MTIRTAIKYLLLATLGLPLLQSLLAWVGALLRAMGDDAAARVVGHINTGAGVAWLASLVGLVVVLGLKAAIEPDVAPLQDDEPAERFE